MKLLKFVMLPTILISLNLRAGETIPGQHAPVMPQVPAPFGAPVCHDKQETIDEIFKIVTAQENFRSTDKALVKAEQAKKYNGYRKLFSGESDAMLLTRLAYAETLAANCPENNMQIAPLILSSIVNRARVRNGDLRSVIFQRNQYASSMNKYTYRGTTSSYQTFLCPVGTNVRNTIEHVRLWNEIFRQAQDHLAKGAGPTKLEPATVSYYLYKHFPNDNGPKTPPGPEQPTTPKIQECVKFFKEPNWK